MGCERHGTSWDESGLERDPAAVNRPGVSSTAVFHPGMTTRGKRIALVLGIVAALALPKKVPCEVPGRECSVHDDLGRTCQRTDLEPLGVYLIELASGGDVPIWYRNWLDCP
jgi:hypothetical protein